MTKIEQVLEALEAAKHAMTNQRYLLPRLGTEDAHAKVTSAIAILKDMDGQEPVAWMNGLGNTKAAKFHDPSNPLGYDIPLYAHPSPSAPVDIAEIIAAGDAMSRALMLNERYNVDGGLDEGMNRIDIECSNAWTTATAKHRTA